MNSLRIISPPEVPPALNALSNYPLAILSSDSPATLKATVESARLQGALLTS